MYLFLLQFCLFLDMRVCVSADAPSTELRHGVPFTVAREISDGTKDTDVRGVRSQIRCISSSCAIGVEDAVHQSEACVEIDQPARAEVHINTNQVAIEFYWCCHCSSSDAGR